MNTIYAYTPVELVPPYINIRQDASGYVITVRSRGDDHGWIGDTGHITLSQVEFEKMIRAVNAHVQA